MTVPIKDKLIENLFFKNSIQYFTLKQGFTTKKIDTQCNNFFEYILFRIFKIDFFQFRNYKKIQTLPLNF
ncbi:hypothetical protein LEP1GSC072_0498 [Leptospira noguchii str. Bonito]|nr:hypothetical protein LEP1GSC072_0498 [Leptospira noguchii str. Bonito]